jgi:hypothetical protein
MRATTGLAGGVAIALLSLLTLRGTGQPEGKTPAKVDPQAVNRAIDRGVVFLKSQQNAADGTWVYRGEGNTKGTLSVGMTALAGLTLLHCGVAAKDPAVQNAARFVRSAWKAALRDANWGRDEDTTYERRTYSVALTVVFLDQLGETGDAALLRVLAPWLLRTQNVQTGSWGYGSTMLPAHHDSSNTQFALLGLWAGRHYGVRISVPLVRTANRCYLTHEADGGWSYCPEEGDKTSTMAMTCVGLLALALRHASANEDILRPRAAGTASERSLSNVAQDKHIVQGFTYLGQTLKAAFEAGNSWSGGSPGRDNAYYALWSMERVAVAYDLRTIAGLDWYDVGARFLLAKQHDDGRWQGAWDQADTCFALLFLRRVNLVPEATRLLEGKIARDDKAGLTSGITSTSSPLASLEKILTPTPAPQPAVKEVTKPLADAPADRLFRKLLDASAAEQELLLKQWRDSEDAAYTPALAKALVTLQGDAQRKARAALADRCTRLNDPQRDEALRSDDAEIRRAAVLSCAVRDDRQHLERLIALLQDKEPNVAEAAYAVLCSLTGQDFGPSASSTAEQRAAAGEAWQSWWKKANGRR